MIATSSPRNSTCPGWKRACWPAGTCSRIAAHPSTWLERDLAADAGDGAAADPHGAVGVLAHVHAAGAAERGALARDVGRARPARGEQPLGQRGVQAPGDRVLVDGAVLVGERADLERLRRAGRAGPDDADVELVVDAAAARAPRPRPRAARRPSPARCRPTACRPSRRDRSAASARPARSSRPRPAPERSSAGPRTPARHPSAGSAPARRRTPARSRRRPAAPRPPPATRGTSRASDARRTAARARA